MDTIQFFIKNIGTVVICLLLIIWVSYVIIKIIRDKRRGKCFCCDCECKSCPKSLIINKSIDIDSKI